MTSQMLQNNILYSLFPGGVYQNEQHNFPNFEFDNKFDDLTSETGGGTSSTHL